MPSKTPSARSVLAKTNRPGAPLIGRDALVAAIADSAAPLTWIVAPAGSGKTCLALEYARRAHGPVAWLRLDEGDVDPASFSQFLEQAVAAGAAAPGWVRPPLQREHLMAPQGYLRVLVRSLATVLAERACIVLDDAHKCQDAPYFRHFLDLLADELPHDVRILVLSRSAPPEACARLLAHGRMHEVEAAALAFSAAETERLLAAQGLPQARAVRDAVFNYTHGWAAGIALVASWLRRRADAMQRLDGIDQLVTGYLATEVFGALSEAERQTLLAICWLPYFRAEWGVALSGDPQATEILGQLAARGALVYEYPGGQHSLHPLYQRFLRDWAGSHESAARRDAWIARSIDLLEAEGDRDNAIELALEHGQMERAAAMISACAEPMIAAARQVTVARWIGRLPEALCSPWLHYWLGMSLYVTDTAVARRSLLKAYDAFVASGDHPRRFVALSMIIVSYSFNGVADEPLTAVLARCLDARRDFDALADPELRANLTLAVLCGLTTADPGHPDRALWEQRAFDLLREAVSQGMKVRLATWLAIDSFFCGRYRRISAARAVLDGQLDLAATPGYQRYLAPFPFMFDEMARGDHEALAATFAWSQQLSEETGFRNMDGHYAVQFADSLMLRGDDAAAQAVLAKAAAAMPPGYYNLAGHLYVACCCQAARRGDAEGALDYARRVTEAGRGFGSVPYELWGRTGACIAGALLGRDVAAEVAGLRRRGAEVDYPAALVHADLLDAYALARAGRDAEALAPLGSGLARLYRESEGFLWCGVPQILAPLCALALRHGVEPEAARAVIRAFRLPAPADAPASWPWLMTLRCFGAFELLVEGRPLPSRGKSKHRQLDLVKFIAAHGPEPVPLGRIAEALWGDSEGDAARHALETTLSRLRTTLGPARDALRVEHGAAGFDKAVCSVDTAHLGDCLGRLDACLAAGGDVAAAAAAVCEVYRGELLHGDGAPWLLSRRDYWRGRAARALGAAARSLEGREPAGEAVRLLERALEADPYSEALTAELMRLQIDGGHPAAAAAVYRRYRHLALSVLGAPPGPEVDAQARRLQPGG